MSSPAGEGSKKELAAESKAATVSSQTTHARRCLCSPTKHRGSFRCRLHRSSSSARLLRSMSMPASKPAAEQLGSKPLETT
ncbi:hypothetical protein ACMD2_24081 [Ananas comosus]|uniref:Uncharacterized protein n=1 Tax=Ananas comosus TaxID=4615 RepID=A0A199UHS1_ANACO|nr:hypothetical protein ACMD2_24081 [Ananas comosus]